MKFTNTIKNVIIAVLAASVTFFIIEITKVKPLEKQITELKADFDKKLDKRDAVIIELAKLDRYKIENKFEKLKPKESTINISLDNKLAALELDSIKKVDPEVSPASKKGFWKRLWGK